MYGAGSSGWRYVVEPEAVHAAVETAFNAGDVDALMGLYEPDARMVRDDASVAVGLDEIRAVVLAGVGATVFIVGGIVFGY
jgi:ketosteroid isomerase-like protein